MAEWFNADASEELMEAIRAEVAVAFREATGQDMPTGFSNWSFNNKTADKTWRFGIAMDSAARALAGSASRKTGGNVPKHDAETVKEIEAWVRYIQAGKGKVQDAPEDLHAAISRALKPVASRLPPAEKVSRLPPEEDTGAAKLPAKGVGMISNAAAMNAARRMTRRAG